jgi:hypothetical protein
MWGGLEVRALAPSTPVTVPVTAIGLQLVGLNVKPGTIDTYVDVLDLQRDPIEDRRERVRGISRLRSVRIDIDTCSKDSVAKVEGATRKRSKRDNRQAGQQLMKRPTRKRSKRGNCRAARVIGPGRGGGWVRRRGSGRVYRCAQVYWLPQGCWPSQV